MSFAQNTKISVPDGTVDIQDIIVGDMALVVNGGVTSASHVRFSQGGDGTDNVMLKLGFDDGMLLVSFYQPVMLSDMTVKKASQLIPRHDRLFGINGQAPLLESLEAGTSSYQFHSIAFSTSATYGNFIIANGIVCGDFATELSMG